MSFAAITVAFLLGLCLGSKLGSRLHFSRRGLASCGDEPLAGDPPPAGWQASPRDVRPEPFSVINGGKT